MVDMMVVKMVETKVVRLDVRRDVQMDTLMVD
jgi:hypothetical protein